MAGDLGRKDVVAQGVAHGARRGVESAGDAAVGSYAAGGDLEEEGVDTFLEGGEFAAVEVFEDAHFHDATMSTDVDVSDAKRRVGAVEQGLLSVCVMNQ